MARAARARRGPQPARASRGRSRSSRWRSSPRGRPSQPQTAVDRADDALAALAAGDIERARTFAVEAGDIDPLSVDPLFALSEVEAAAQQPAAAQAALERAVQLQPAVPDTWIRLAQYQLLAGDAAAAQRTVRPALYLDPRSAPAQAIFLEASRKLAAAERAKAKTKAKSKKG